MVRSCKGIEMLVNLINICYCAMKILPYQDEQFSEYRTKSVQQFRFELSQGIRSQIFLTNFVRNIETHIKSSAPLDPKGYLLDLYFVFYISPIIINSIILYLPTSIFSNSICLQNIFLIKVLKSNCIK